MEIDERVLRWQENLRAGSVRELFEFLPNLLFFMKDRELRLMGGNRSFVERCGFRDEREMIGLLDREVFPVEMAEKFFQDDLKVIESGEALTGIVEVFPNRMGELEWFVTDKIPLFDRDGRVAGLCGLVRSYEGARAEIAPYLEMLPVIRLIEENYAEKISVSDFSGKLGLSVRQFERKFRQALGTSPRRYLLRYRIMKACEILVKTDVGVTEVAMRVGFFDHSALTKHFIAIMGVTPGVYRRKWQARRRK